MKRTDVKLLKDMRYCEIARLDDYFDLRLEADHDSVCIKCRESTESYIEHNDAGLCPVCEAEMDSADKKAFNKRIEELWGPIIDSEPLKQPQFGTKRK